MSVEGRDVASLAIDLRLLCFIFRHKGHDLQLLSIILILKHFDHRLKICLLLLKLRDFQLEALRLHSVELDLLGQLVQVNLLFDGRAFGSRSSRFDCVPWDCGALLGPLTVATGIEIGLEI